MKLKYLMFAASVFLTSSCINVSPRKSTTSLDDYCFSPSSLSMGVERASTVPSAYIHNHEEVTAVINGMYYGTDGKSMGIAYANGEEYANGDKKQVTGYFSISKSGKVRITESLPNKKNYNFVIGTRPLLVTESEVNYQAKKERYAGPAAYRSAIGIKEGNVCFAVSEHPVKMQKWAELLQRAGYSGALNLDGGPVSELAVREDKIKSYGPGNLNTHLVIFASRSD